jgi:hypothetical protein
MFKFVAVIAWAEPGGLTRALDAVTVPVTPRPAIPVFPVRSSVYYHDFELVAFPCLTSLAIITTARLFRRAFRVTHGPESSMRRRHTNGHRWRTGFAVSDVFGRTVPHCPHTRIFAPPLQLFEGAGRGRSVHVMPPLVAFFPSLVEIAPARFLAREAVRFTVPRLCLFFVEIAILARRFGCGPQNSLRSRAKALLHRR